MSDRTYPTPHKPATYKEWEVEWCAENDRVENIILLVAVYAPDEQRAVADAETEVRGLVMPGTRLFLNGAKLRP